MEVSHCTTNLEEDGTEVLHQEEATSNQPVPEGTEIPLRRINSTHYNQDNTSLKHEIFTTAFKLNFLILPRLSHLQSLLIKLIHEQTAFASKVNE